MEFIDVPTEQTTAITDIVLAVIAAGCAVYLRKVGRNEPWKANVWSWSLSLLAFAAVLGFVAHGFKMSDKLNSLVWKPLDLSLGMVIALFVVGVIYDLRDRDAARIVLPWMVAAGAVFYVVTLIRPRTFLIFIVYEAVALCFSFCVYVALAIRKRLPGAWLMTAGILVSILAACIQAGESIHIHILWQFNHDGVFHIVQIFGVILLTAGLRQAFVDTRYDTSGSVTQEG